MNRLRSFEVDGRRMTYQAIADELCVSVNALRGAACRYRDISMQEIVDRYRSGKIRRISRCAHCVHGRWMTVDEAAAELHLQPGTLRKYKSRWGEPTLEATVDRYIRQRETQRRGSEAVRHPVRGRMLTVDEAAAKLGVPKQRLYAMIWYHKCTLAEAVERCERAREARARNTIVRILRERR